MSHDKLYPVPEQFAKQAFIKEQKYHQLYQRSIEDPNGFWAEKAHEFITWFKPWSEVSEGNFSDLNVKWFLNGQLNACYNCLDRHLDKRKNQIAIIWEGNNPNESKTFTYNELYIEVCKFANVLKNLGVKKGDRVCIYLSMIPIAAISMLACARLGAIHSVVFGGFSPDSLKTRILDAQCKLLITADEAIRGEKTVALKANADKALQDCPDVEHVVVVKHTGGEVKWNADKDIWYHDAISRVSDDCPVETMDSTDPLFILYTSGSTGKPKGVLHGNGGYMVYTATTFKYVFDYHEGDIFWCTADVGWITGHSYLIYGPLANGATTLMFEGVPNYPTYTRFWEIIDKHQVNIFYTAPTAIRAIRREGDALVERTSRRSLKLLGSVGEPINPDVWEWYFDVVGDKRCPIVDTWWQTETGGIMITPLPGATPMAPGSASRPFFGIVPDVVDDKGNGVNANQHGKLVIKQPWPGMMQTIYGDHERFVDAYFKEIPGCYLTGDAAYQDNKGYFWIIGRTDDVIKVSGHRLGSEEVESALLAHHAVSEAAVVGVPNEITGEEIYAFVTTQAHIEPTESLKEELINKVRDEIGPIAKPHTIQWTQALPKTRSGKIMRRILRKIAKNELEELGDTSTLADPSVIDTLIADRKNHL
ncbi:acetate--CoA ligase [Legionella impletisoli]|uniref:Acetyl-coenzyme A synthetase n=1 Tax=Legionella impletisoli TaxID=343510 RepID=A0A917NE77_9GAMM|nr:acetate--CoA ligase [Legionella impletisoli]GGI92078.1 acetyl-coenzyme A synthetase 2 [Legionella impletisoli]